MTRNAGREGFLWMFEELALRGVRIHHWYFFSLLWGIRSTHLEHFWGLLFLGIATECCLQNCLTFYRRKGRLFSIFCLSRCINIVWSKAWLINTLWFPAEVSLLLIYEHWHISQPVIAAEKYTPVCITKSIFMTVSHHQRVLTGLFFNCKLSLI